jgi:copper chaperone NosL
MKRRALLMFALALPGCASGPPEPAPLDTRNEACAACRMAVSEARFAAQLVSPGELPRFFDDIGCLAGFVKAGRAPSAATAFVADHETRAWVRADAATYTRVPNLATPMGSHLIAHADAASRDRDPAARGGTPVTAVELFGPSRAAAGSER